MTPPTEQAITFTADGLTLSGVLHRPPGLPLAVVLGCHGLMADKQSPKQIELAARCTAMGMAYFRFDHRGCGESQGCFETDTTLENRRCDLMAAVDAVGRALNRNLPVGLFGSSFGGTVCLAAAGDVGPFALVTLAAPVQSRSIHIPEDSPQSLRSEIIRPNLLFDVSAIMATVGHILVIHGDCDETVPVENAHTIYDLAQEPKKRLILRAADHRISRRSHQERFMEAAVGWFWECYQNRP